MYNEDHLCDNKLVLYLNNKHMKTISTRLFIMPVLGIFLISSVQLTQAQEQKNTSYSVTISRDSERKEIKTVVAKPELPVLMTASADVPESPVILKIYPNPGNGLFNMALQSPESGSIYFKISDITGKTLMQEEVADFKAGNNIHRRFDLSEYPDGIYFVKINQNGNTSTQKIIKGI